MWVLSTVYIMKCNFTSIVVHISTTCLHEEEYGHRVVNCFYFSALSYATQTYAVPDGSVATSTGATQAAVAGYAGYGTTGIYSI